MTFSLILAVAMSASASSDARFDGPIPSADWNPLHETFYNLRPDAAETLSKGDSSFRFNIARTNSMEGLAFADGGQGLLHAETTRTELELRLGLAKDLEGELMIPVLARSSPLMDGFIGKVEDAWMGHRMPTRARYGGTPMKYEVNIPGQGIVRDNPGTTVGLGDPAFVLKFKLLDESDWGPAVALRAGIKAPMGDRTLGFGSGTFDATAGITLQRTITAWLRAYMNLMMAAPADASKYVRPFAQASLALEALVGPVSIVAQADTLSSPYKGTGQRILDGRDDLILLAVRYNTTVAGHPVSAGVFASENMMFYEGYPRWAGSADDFTIGTLLSIETNK
jgi:hypothetical protein